MAPEWTRDWPLTLGLPSKNQSSNGKDELGVSDSLLLGFELGNMEIIRSVSMDSEVERMSYNGVRAMEGHTNQIYEEAEQSDKKAEFMNKQQSCSRKNT